MKTLAIMTEDTRLCVELLPDSEDWRGTIYDIPTSTRQFVRFTKQELADIMSLMLGAVEIADIHSTYERLKKCIAEHGWHKPENFKFKIIS